MMRDTRERSDLLAPKWARDTIDGWRRRRDEKAAAGDDAGAAYAGEMAQKMEAILNGEERDG